MEIVFKSLKDLFSIRFLKYSLLPFIILVVFAYIVFLVLVGIGFDQITSINQNIEMSDIEDTSTFISYMMSFAFVSWMVHAFVYVFGALVIIHFSIFVSIILIGFMTPYIIKDLHDVHYKDVELKGFGNVFESIWLNVKYIVVMVLLFLVLVPLYFVPFINILAINFPLYYYFHKMINFDVASEIATREEFKKILDEKGSEIRLKTLLLYLISLIPFAVLFATVFYILFMGHTYFAEIKSLRNTQKNDDE